MENNLAFREPPRYEIIDGKVVMMAPAVSNHNRVALNIANIFYNYLEGKPCEFYQDGEGLYLENEQEYIPDGMVVCDPSKDHGDGIYGAPDLVIEVLSPSTARYDRMNKKNAYERHGVREYWIADPANRIMEQYVLEEGKFVLRGIYAQCQEMELRRMTEEEKAGLVTEFQCAVFDDLTVRLDKIFARVRP